MEELVGRVSSVLSECAQYSNDSTNLDRLCFLLRGVSSEIGSLLDEILVTRQRNVESGELIKLQELNTCVGELCVQYETNLFRSFTQLDWKAEESYQHSHFLSQNENSARGHII